MEGKRLGYARLATVRRLKEQIWDFSSMFGPKEAGEKSKEYRQYWTKEQMTLLMQDS